jgi:hypothetical protein
MMILMTVMVMIMGHECEQGILWGESQRRERRKEKAIEG